MALANLSAILRPLHWDKNKKKHTSMVLYFLFRTLKINTCNLYLRISRSIESLSRLGCNVGERHCWFRLSWLFTEEIEHLFSEEFDDNDNETNNYDDADHDGKVYRPVGRILLSFWRIWTIGVSNGRRN